MWACGAAGSALPWHGRGHRFDPDQVHQLLVWSEQLLTLTRETSFAPGVLSFSNFHQEHHLNDFRVRFTLRSSAGIRRACRYRVSSGNLIAAITLVPL